MLREGSGEPLLLLHGILGGERMWSHVIPLLAAHHDVIAPTALGHHGGPPATVRPVRHEHVVDAAERLLDELGLEKVHLAGNSMGGHMAIDLARRGRALTVCAFSPAGAWQAGTSARQRPAVLRATVRDTRRARPVLGLPARSRRFRHWALRYLAAHGERVSRDDFLALADDTIGCEIVEDLLRAGAQLEPLEEPPCPITLAWSGRDRLFPVDVHGARARELIPGADFIVLQDVGHVPMLDDPQLVARTILAVTTKSPTSI
ncbi:MAG: alpha/beta fold hydrolase [Solirubrobacterales bacterium]